MQRLRDSLLSLPLFSLLAACGGGGGSATDGPAAIAGVVSPTSFSALTAEEEAVVDLLVDVASPSCRLVDEAGEVLGPGELALEATAGRTLRVAMPVLEDARDGDGAFVEVRDGAGPWRRLPTRLRVARLVDGVRSIDGSGNNEDRPLWGAVGARFRREAPDAYGDGVSSPSGADRPGARAVSNAVAAQDASMPNERGLSDLFWLFGQFLDHDLDLTLSAVPAERFDVAVPPGDPSFDPLSTGTRTIPLSRSAYDPASGDAPQNPRRQTNAITAWIDASQVYGSDETTARSLRALDGTGRLRTSAGDLLPFDESAPAGSPPAFVAGDFRVNEQVGLAAMHVVFLREHNRVAEAVRTRNPGLSDDAIYETARRWIGAELQAIAYREFLPALLGRDAIAPYRGYDPGVDPAVGILFSTASYRFGHSMVSGRILRLDADGREVPEGSLSLRDAFFGTSRLVTEGGVDPVLRGLALQRAQRLDPFLVDDLRNFLFGPPGAGGLDLASLNVQRGRDHGLPGYAACRAAYGLPPRAGLEGVSSDPVVVARLASVYASPEALDPWVGGLAEDPVRGAAVGPLVRAVLRDQFERTRDGDRFWYQRLFQGEALEELERTRLADVIRRNTGIRGEIGDLALWVPDAQPGPPREDDSPVVPVPPLPPPR
jgi:peroxidase